MHIYFKTQQNKINVSDIQQYQDKFIREMKSKKTYNYPYNFIRKPKTFLLLDKKQLLKLFC